jgi:hypothetical protein
MYGNGSGLWVLEFGIWDRGFGLRVLEVLKVLANEFFLIDRLGSMV